MQVRWWWYITFKSYKKKHLVDTDILSPKSKLCTFAVIENSIKHRLKVFFIIYHYSSTLKIILKIYRQRIYAIFKTYSYYNVLTSYYTLTWMHAGLLCIVFLLKGNVST